MSRILSIAPYKFLPPVNGGHLGVILVEKVLSVFNKVDTLTTDNNTLGKPYPFTIHPVLSSSKLRYLPFSQYSIVSRSAEDIKPDYMFCHHHYMYPMAKKVAARRKLPLYIRCHNIESERFRSTGKWWWKAMWWFERAAFRDAAAVFFVTAEDRQWAIRHYGINEQKAVVMPFGIDFESVPVLTGSKQSVASQYALDPDVPWLFFMGQLDYGPNEQAVQRIIREIVPRLKKNGLVFRMLLCGKGLSAALQEEVEQAGDELHYLGFVPEIEPVIASCDVMVNPVQAGGGVKTKVVESLAWNKTVVSAFTGAIGIEASVCGGKLRIVPDNDWEQFVASITTVLQQPLQNIPDTFFDFYFSRNIAERMQNWFR